MWLLLASKTSGYKRRWLEMRRVWHKLLQWGFVVALKKGSYNLYLPLLSEFACFKFDAESPIANKSIKIDICPRGLPKKCYVEQYEGCCIPFVTNLFVYSGKEISRGCGSCSEGWFLWRGEYREGGRMDEAHEKVKQRLSERENARPTIARNQSVEYSCTDCDSAMCNDESLRFRQNLPSFLL